MAERLPGLLIDPDRRIRFSFDGTRYEGCAGDTIASALAANGEWALSRSGRLGRPRGVFTMAGRDGNTLVWTGDSDWVPADRIAISEGLQVSSMDRATKRRRDRQGDERAAETIHGFYDVAVVGGGLAGLSAALQAWEQGARVLLVDENPTLGGALLYSRTEGAHAAVRAELMARIEGAADIHVLTGATCFGWYADHRLPITAGGRVHRVCARQTVVATGVCEQPAVFRNNDLPGVMLGSAAQRLIRLYGVRPGRRGVVLTANEHGHEVALDLVEAGVEVATVVDLRSAATGRAAEALREAEVEIREGSAIWEAVGRTHVKAVRVSKIIGQGRCAQLWDTIDCDLVCVSVGYVPDGALLEQAGVAFRLDHSATGYRLSGGADGVFAAGSVNGVFEPEAVLADGRRAGAQACRIVARGWSSTPGVPAHKGGAAVNHPWPIFPHPQGQDFVDLDADLEVADVLDAAADGCDDLALVQRQTGLGLSPSQGRLCHGAALRLLAKAAGQVLEGQDFSVLQRPAAGQSLAQLAAPRFEPVRRSVLHRLHLDAGAHMTRDGGWLLPAQFRISDEGKAVTAEVRAARAAVGLLDLSNLGGFEVRGRDAGELLERLFTGAFADQPVGRARYTLLCDRTGAVVGDAVVSRLHRHHFYVTPGAASASISHERMWQWNAEWGLSVDVTDASAAICCMALVGPNSHEIVARLTDQPSFAPHAFSPFAVAEADMGHVPVRVVRTGFMGGLCYELHAPAGEAESLWTRLVEAGRDLGILPVGSRARALLRLDQGHPVVGQDTDGRASPDEIGLGRVVARSKSFFLGQQALAVRAAAGPSRRLVGFTLADARARAPGEGALVLRDGEIAGRVTSCAHSPGLGMVVGLALVTPGLAEPGRTFEIARPGAREMGAVVTDRPFGAPRSAAGAG